jgi:hypothetical protein
VDRACSCTACTLLELRWFAAGPLFVLQRWNTLVILVAAVATPVFLAA